MCPPTTPGPIICSAALVVLCCSPATAVAQEELFALPLDRPGPKSFGDAVSLSIDHVAIGAPEVNSPWHFCGAAFLFDASTGQQLFELRPADGRTIQWFGKSIAVHENRVLVGAPGDDDHGFNAGAAYVFDATTGQELSKLFPSTTSQSARFGYSLALDGSRAVIAAPNTGSSGCWMGAVHVFDATTWQELIELHPSSACSSGPQFGFRVAIDGDRAVIGAPFDDDLGLDSGSAYVFDLNTGQELFKLLPSDGAPDDRFGYSLAISGDRIVVGSPADDDHGEFSGSAYVFDSTTGQQMAKLLPGDGHLRHLFGASCGIVGDRALIGGNGDGGIYVFDIYTANALDTIIPTAAPCAFGDALGDLAVMVSVGASYGRAYVFDFDGPGSTYCFGDLGSGTPCPCGNDNDRSLPGSGCDNGVFPSGAKLYAAGEARTGADTLVLTGFHAEPNNVGLFFQGDSRVHGGDGLLFGDGLRCAGSGVVRLQVRISDSTGSSRTTIPLAAAGGVVAGDLKRYQLWYRTTAAPPCGTGVNEFNLSNGYEVLWAP